MKEIWKDVVEYEGLYQISSLGRLRSIDKIRDGFSYKNGKITKRFYKGKIIKQSIIGYGYPSTAIMKNGTYKTVLIHRLVAKAFIENPENKLYVNHIDFNTRNNYFENLEWCTAFENIHHTMNHGRNRQLYGEENGHSKIKNNQIIDIFGMSENGISQYKIARHYGVHQSTINKILRRITYKKINHATETR